MTDYDLVTILLYGLEIEGIEFVVHVMWRVTHNVF
jgi:hypothetical protein